MANDTSGAPVLSPLDRARRKAYWRLLPLLFMAMAAHGFGAPEILAHRAVWSVFVAGLVLLLALIIIFVAFLFERVGWRMTADIAGVVFLVLAFFAAKFFGGTLFPKPPNDFPHPLPPAVEGEEWS